VGDFIHAVLEKTLREAESRGGMKNLTLSDLLTMGRREAARYEQEWFHGRRKTARTAYQFRRLNIFLANMLENLYNELFFSEFSPIFFDLDFSPSGEMPPVEVVTGDGESLRLQGRVDRVDGFEKEGELYIRVVDYKTGGKKFDFTEVLNGLGMQMLIYLFAIEKNGVSGRKVVPAGVLYIPGMGTNTVDLPRGSDEKNILRKKDEAMRRYGLVLDDMDIVRAMEPGASRRFIPVKMTANGFDKNSNVASPEQMKLLAEHVEKTLKRLGIELQNGFTQANPYRRGPEQTACDYCEFKPICLFDESNGRDRFRSLSGVTKDEFWEQIGKEEAK
jgi:ATP-dependent helicase/nuclease subunit B